MIFTGSGNANKISGIPVIAGTPPDTYTLNYDAASNYWIYVASGSPAGGSVGGGASVAATQVLYGVSPGTAGSSSLFKYFSATTGNLTLGSGTDDTVNRLQVTGSIKTLGASGSFDIGRRDTNASVYAMYSSAGNFQLFHSINGADVITLSGTTTVAYNLFNKLATTGNTTVNIGTDGSTSSAVATQLIVRAGSGQSSTNLQAWQNAAGTEMAALASGGFFNTTAGYHVNSNKAYLQPTVLDFSSDYLLRFSSTTAHGGTKDLSLSRSSAGVLQVGDGGNNANGFLDLKTVRPVGSTVALLPATPATGMLATVTDANATTIDSTVAGGGSNVVGVWYNGTAWKIYSGGAGSGGSPGGSGTELQVRGGASTFSALASSSVPNAGELWIGQTTASASATRALFQVGSVALSGFSTSGTQLAVNATSGFTGNLIDARVNSAAGFSVSAFGLVNTANLSLTGTSGIVFSSNNSVPVGSSSSGASAATRFIGSAGVAATNFVAIRNSSGGTPTDQVRINGDQKAVMVGQTANTTSLANVSMYVSDRTASGNTQHVIEGGGSQSTDILSVYANNATPLAGTKHVAVISTGQFRSVGILVASLPVAAAGNSGAIATVTDALTPTLGVAVAGGGAVTALVFSNGSVWKVAAF